MTKQEEQEISVPMLLGGLILFLGFFVFVYYAGHSAGELKVYSMPKMGKCI